MLDPLKAAEDAARVRVQDAVGIYRGSQGYMMATEALGEVYGDLDAYRDAIIARRDAEVAALVEAAQWEDMCVNCAHGEAYHTGFGATACALCEFACPEFRPKQMLRAALAPFTKEVGQ